MPTELILDIFSYLNEPEDIDNLALVSRLIRNKAKKCLSSHTELKKTFTKIEAGYNASICSLLASYVKHFHKNPLHAFYVKELKIAPWKSEWDLSEGEEEHNNDEKAKKKVEPLDFKHPPQQHRRYDEEDMVLFSNVVQGARLVRRSEHRQWATAISLGDEDPVATLLLVMLPNLKKLSFTPPSGRYWSSLLYRTMKRILESPASLAPLRQLEAADLGLMGSRRVQEDLEAFAQLSQLESVKELVERDIHLDDQNRRLAHTSLLPRPRISRIASLSLIGTTISHKRFKKSLESFKNLDSFTYIRTSEAAARCVQGLCEELDPYEIIVGILAYHRTLRLLTLRTRSEGDYFMGSIRELKALQALETECNLLIPSADLDLDRSMALMDVLPEAIERLTLHVSNNESFSYHALGTTISVLVEHNNEQCPLLEEIKIIFGGLERLSFFCQEFGFTSVQDHCRQRGIDLIVVADADSFIRDD